MHRLTAHARVSLQGSPNDPLSSKCTFIDRSTCQSATGANPRSSCGHDLDGAGAKSISLTARTIVAGPQTASSVFEPLLNGFSITALDMRHCARWACYTLLHLVSMVPYA